MQDPETAKIHLDGAKRMVKQRGGLRSLQADEEAGIMGFWSVLLQQRWYE
jgi:hypothetical protein